MESSAEQATRDYLNGMGIESALEQIAEKIREKPLGCAAIAAAVGFAAGGGRATYPSLAIFALIGRDAARQIGISLISGLINPSRH